MAKCCPATCHISKRYERLTPDPTGSKLCEILRKDISWDIENEPRLPNRVLLFKRWFVAFHWSDEKITKIMPTMTSRHEDAFLITGSLQVESSGHWSFCLFNKLLIYQSGIDICQGNLVIDELHSPSARHECVERVIIFHAQFKSNRQCVLPSSKL